MAARSKAKPRARSRPRAKRSSTKLPILEQRHLDLVGLGLVALSVFLAFVLYGGWQGGRAGEGMVDGLGWLVGRIRFLACRDPEPTWVASTVAAGYHERDDMSDTARVDRLGLAKD